MQFGLDLCNAQILCKQNRVQRYRHSHFVYTISKPCRPLMGMYVSRLIQGVLVSEFQIQEQACFFF